MVDRVGQRFGNYRLLNLLGSGGFADVYLGEHVYLRTYAAIKVSSDQLTSQQEQEFLNEARTIAQLIHPNIVRILEFGIEQKKMPYLVMVYAPNGTLRTRHPRGTQLPLSTIISYVKPIASALQTAHDKKIIHRDIKPQNMLVGQNNEIWLSDFGIAVIAHTTRSQTTQDVAGSWEYTAPEQFTGKAVLASDQYALGIVVYEWLSGFPPFDGSFVELYHKHRSVPPTPLRVSIPTIPSDVEQVLLKALAKDPNQRFAHVQEFVEALEKASLSLHGPAAPKPQLSPRGILAPPQPVATPRVGTIYFTYTGHSQRVSSIAWSIVGTHIMSSSQDSVQIWDVSTGKSKVYYQAPGAYTISTSSWSSDELYTALALSNTVDIWDNRNKTQVFSYGGHFKRVHGIAWSPDRVHVASIDEDGDIHIWDVNTGYTILSVSLGSSYAQRLPNSWGSDPWQHNSGNSLSWSPDGKYLVLSTDQRVQIRDTGDGTIVADVFGNEGRRGGINFSPDRKWIASGINNGVQVKEVSTQKSIFLYTGHKNHANAAAWSPRQIRIASGSIDTTVQVRDALTGKNVFTFRGHSTDVTAVAWSPNGQYIASSDGSSRIQIWQAI